MTLIGSRYEVVDTLGEGGMGVVYLAHDKLRNYRVALKQVLLSDDAQRLAITREFRTLSTLRHPNIVSVIEYGSHEGQPYFTMEYLPNSQPFDKAVNQNIDLFIQMLQALGYLHRRGILHRDLKPANVLVTANSVVKVLDFGLAGNTGGKGGAPEGAVGTITYMSPELFQEEPPSVGSDLWAVGVMLCQALTGHHPFDSSSPTNLLISLFNDEADLSGMDEEISEVVARLLSKDTATRYTNALDVIRDLCNAAGIELAPESKAHRESFLQAAAFVGRDYEYQCLADALKTAANGTSQLWLIGGEAGAGKSRLLDEVRTRALVDGFVVLQGQGVERGGLPYQVWRDPARKLVLGTPMSDLTASVLKELVPDIGHLLGREIHDIPTLDAKAHRDRLMAAILERLKAPSSPVLMILEDLHWANEGLDLLKMLLPTLQGMPVIVVGSYRNDEKPTLPDAFPTANLLTLERLTLEAVAALSTSMIGAENATPELVERLTRETEGNALFMVEVVRALAEEAGSLQDISRKSLPDRILAGGMIAVLRRRLARVPAWALDTLKLAAVLGRVIDIPVLKAAGVQDIEAWLHACAEAAVLEPYSGEWRFSHDRLRETLLHNLTDLSPLHEKASLALEAVYPDNLDYAEALAHHWRIAGNAEREGHYIVKAAEHLVAVSDDYERADRLIQRGLELNQPHIRAALMLWAGYGASKQGRFPEAVTAFKSGLEADPSPDLKALILNRFGEVCLRLGQHVDAVNYVTQAKTIAEQNNDQRNIAVSLNLLGILAYYQGDAAKARQSFEESLVIGRAIGNRPSTSSSLNNLGNVAVFQGDYDAACKYIEESLQLERAAGNRSGMAGSLNNMGNVAVYQGDYETARTYFEDTLQIYRDIGDRRGLAFSLENLGTVAFYQDDLKSACAAFEESLVICNEIGVRNISVYSESGLVIVLTHLGEGKRSRARDHLINALKTALELDAQLLMLLALLGASYWMQGQDERVAQWIGLMGEKGGSKIKEDARFKRQQEALRARLGVKAFEEAVEHGKTLDAKSVVQALLAELTTLKASSTSSST